jgi:alpha-glucosidase
MLPWTRDGVVYQVYPRSFQDSNGDGSGDLPGITARLDHLQWLGADAVWLSPIYPSPMADMGYDVSDYQDVDPMYGTLADADALIAAAHERDLKVLFDIVPCHTSIEHRWFREHPDWYVWSDRDGPQNNWRAAFGGPAWSRDERSGRWYLHSFYPEQPDLDFRNPEVREAVGDVLRFWLDRGVDGFRLDAIDRLMKDPQRRDDPPATRPPVLPLPEDHAQFEHVHSRNAPDIGDAMAALRAAAPDAFLVGEVYLPSSELRPYLEHLDVAFAFELFHAHWNGDVIRAAIDAGTQGEDAGRLAWVLSNHDFPRLPTRVGPANVRAAALLALTLPGVVFVFQGDEIGMPDGGGRGPDLPPVDRFGRDAHRHPVRWSDAEPHGGFSTGRALAAGHRGRGRRGRRAARGPRLAAVALQGPHRDPPHARAGPDAARGRRGRGRLPPRRRPPRRAQPRAGRALRAGRRNPAPTHARSHRNHSAKTSSGGGVRGECVGVAGPTWGGGSLSLGS